MFKLIYKTESLFMKVWTENSNKKIMQMYGHILCQHHIKCIFSNSDTRGTKILVSMNWLYLNQVLV